MRKKKEKTILKFLFLMDSAIIYVQTDTKSLKRNQYQESMYHSNEKNSSKKREYILHVYVEFTINVPHTFCTWCWCLVSMWHWQHSWKFGAILVRSLRNGLEFLCLQLNRNIGKFRNFDVFALWIPFVIHCNEGNVPSK